ncbi:DUF3987 domain-containing protein [Prauserella halophila]|uniref:DUF3987 domain-containing protein n=1 Tax=Prauserella halophila TaxID=185641 RepID=UPI0020A2E1DD|nr:DUF3987 domain-containing protein [Prauserella halophila]MCP2234743.1 Protein of unknown function (DUF3987) [Prauserella halophila]
MTTDDVRRPPPEIAVDEQDVDESPVDRVVSFPTLTSEALQGTAGWIVESVVPHSEAHPAAVLATLLARFGVVVGREPHVRADNRTHPTRVCPLIVGKTSTGAKGTSAGVVDALFDAAEFADPGGVPKVGGLSSGEGLIDLVRDGTGDDPDAKTFDEGVVDKRVYIEEPEFAGTLSVMERNGSILPRVLREAWDGGVLRTLTRGSPLTATGAHIVIVGHATPGELKARLTDAQLAGGTMNRFLPIASRRTKLCPDGGNIPENIVGEVAGVLAERAALGWKVGEVKRTAAADELWRAQYGHVRRERPDGAVAKFLSRAVPQVLRLSLAYALLDGHHEVDEPHLRAALALWEYASASAEWLFGTEPDSGEQDRLVEFIAAAGAAGRSKTEVANGHFAKNRKAAEIDAILRPLIEDGRIRQEVTPRQRGRPSTRYFTTDRRN